jgi:phosphoribosylformimino-5-aminoimidazole carboxamide ribotide isomerase
MVFRIYPAVDIKGGKCVRLYQGDLQRETVYSDNPWEAALAWENKGASFLHLVDLDGAAGNAPANLDAVKAILARVKIPVQFGGGVRGMDDIDMVLSLGVERVILGTRAIEEEGFAYEALRLYGSKVIISVDTRGVEIAVSGWSRTAERSLEDVMAYLERSGAERVIHTDISRDGTLEGYDTRAIEPLLDRGMGVIAAGGISSIADLEALKALTPRGLEGAVIGRAIYTGDIDLAEALALEED